MNNQITLRPATRANLVSQIFGDPNPEKRILELPAQAIHVALRHNGLGAYPELLPLISRAQLQIVFDLDLWNRDRLHEDALWEWLDVLDSETDLSLLRKFVNSVDLKILCCLISKWIDIVTLEERTEQPPQEGFRSPDNGYTWVRIHIESPEKAFLLGKVLALIFESDPAVFYQLISIPNVETFSSLEDQSYEDKLQRLEAEGFPTDEEVFELHQPLRNFSPSSEHRTMKLQESEISGVQPLIYDMGIVKPFGELIRLQSNNPAFEFELTRITNAALLHYQIPQYDTEAVQTTIETVRGTVNIGLEIMMEKHDLSLTTIIADYPLSIPYQLGLAELAKLRQFTKRLSSENFSEDANVNALETIASLLQSTPPQMPEFFARDGSYQEEHPGKLAVGSKAIEHLDEAEALYKHLVDAMKVA